MSEPADLRNLHPSFSRLPDASVARLAAASSERRYPAGTVIFEADGAADEFFVIRNGLVALQMIAPGRAPLVVETLGPGELLGVSWAFPPYRWNWSAVAQSDVEAVAFQTALVYNAAHEDPVLRAALLEAVASEAIGRLHATRMRLLDVYWAAS
jgi:CRP/FNR family transcriptional regulator, cyclic AMP receptor protein